MSPVPLHVAAPPVGSVSQSPHLTFSDIGLLRWSYFVWASPKGKIFLQRVPMSYISESGPGVAAWSHETTSSILYLVANQIQDGRVVVSSLILSLSLRAFCRHGGATARDVQMPCPYVPCFPLLYLQIFVGSSRNMAHSMDSQATGVPEARYHGLSRDSVSLVQCTVATGSVAFLWPYNSFLQLPRDLSRVHRGVVRPMWL